ncbi:hypothetical protein IscW_ISCW003376 [Ixodes scapularis]|uniref:Uncharacterized protein n=1 Tax=Ixodes scapularis TaxID=6945 RepID=B7PCY6_IXOSC|nr:hypothetical protein IscW_ISCW003376 [Ixodes scapularis]|eukprot:XP_002410439.1 hypothetical protein IscW_ISCW003376 [Ixodes scapularis]
MKELENKTFEIRDPKDVFFFVSAMDVCHSHLLDKELAYKVHALLSFGGNYNLIGDSFKESIYYQHFFKLLCSTENIDTFFDIYNKYVPNVNIILFGHYERENVVKAVLEVMAKRKQESKLQAQFAVIAADINERCDGDQETRRTRPIQWTGQMFGKMISVFLNAERLQDAWQIMQKLDKEQHRILGYPEQECLKKFCQACLDNSDETKALFCARYAAEIGLTDVGEHLRQGENIKKLSENAKQKLAELLNSSALNSSEIYSKED